MEKIKLNTPIKIDGIEINELNLRAPKVCYCDKSRFRIRTRSEFDCG